MVAHAPVNRICNGFHLAVVFVFVSALFLVWLHQQYKSTQNVVRISCCALHIFFWAKNTQFLKTAFFAGLKCKQQAAPSTWLLVKADFH